LGQVERTAFPRCRATFPAPILVNDRYFFAHARTESPTPIESLPTITLKLADLTLQFTRNILILISHAVIGPNYTEVALVATIAIPTSAISPVALRTANRLTISHFFANVIRNSPRRIDYHSGAGPQIVTFTRDVAPEAGCRGRLEISSKLKENARSSCAI